MEKMAFEELFEMKHAIIDAKIAYESKNEWVFKEEGFETLKENASRKINTLEKTLIFIEEMMIESLKNK